MTRKPMQLEPLADSSAAARPHGAGTSSPRASAQWALLRALLAGAVALILMLLPAQLAASRDEVAASSRVLPSDADAAVVGARGDRSEIRRRETC